MPAQHRANRVTGSPGWRMGTAELLLWPTYLYLYLFLVMRLGAVDRTVASWFASPDRAGFALRHDFLAEHVLHDVAQGTMRVVLMLLVLLWLSSWPSARLRPFRRSLGYLVLTAAVSVAVVNVGKQFTNVDCPWDLQEYGGTRLPHDLLDPPPPQAPVGHCFPGGHSSSGFALLGLFFVVRLRSHSRAWLGLLPGLALGALFAVTQWTRGAHVPSHDLTSAYLCWIVAVLGNHWLLSERS